MPYRRGQMECSQCHSSVEPSWNACPTCGNVLVAAKECELCGAGMLSAWKACPACGAGAIAADAKDEALPKAVSRAIPGEVDCPECGKNRARGDTFKCRLCGRENLCQEHRDPASNGCESCAAKARQQKLGKLRQSHRGFGEQWENSLGMKFVRVPRIDALFSVWVTRVRDYELFAAESGIEPTKPSFEQGPSHPAVYVNWHDARAFCQWLTEKEQEEEALESGMVYRLPNDLEWSCAVGLPAEGGNTPKSRDEKIPDHYPWGSEWPPPKRAGNYDQDLRVDRHSFTSPVGTFKANSFGMYDLGGNVWEWCQDWYDDEESARVLRGASWSNYGQGILLSSCRRNCAPDFRNDYIGFRCVLADA